MISFNCVIGWFLMFVLCFVNLFYTLRGGLRPRVDLIKQSVSYLKQLSLTLKVIAELIVIFTI